MYFLKIRVLIDFNLPLRFRKAGMVWCGGAREIQLTTSDKGVTPGKPKEFLKSLDFLMVSKKCRKFSCFSIGFHCQIFLFNAKTRTKGKGWFFSKKIWRFGSMEFWFWVDGGIFDSLARFGGELWWFENLKSTTSYTLRKIKKIVSL